MVRVGGGFEKFIEYVPKNHRYFERTLVVHMIKSGESLEWVLDALMNAKKIKNIMKGQDEPKNQQEDSNNIEELKKRVSSKSPKR